MRFVAAVRVSAGRISCRQGVPVIAAQPMIGRLFTGRLGLQIPLFRAPAACWCARATVKSTDTSQVISPAASARACEAVRICAQAPVRCQRRNSPYTDSHGPYRSGRSRHGAPARSATGSHR